MFNLPRADKDVPEAERLARLTDSFLADLAEAPGAGRIVLFFDATEKMSDPTRAWLWDEMLLAVRDLKLGGLAAVVAVVCGQRKPPEGRDWNCLELAELQPLELPHVIEYLGRRGVDEKDRAVVAKVLLATVGGKVADIAKAVDLYQRLDKRLAGGAA
jgi:hypothetical protein